ALGLTYRFVVRPWLNGPAYDAAARDGAATGEPRTPTARLALAVKYLHEGSFRLAAEELGDDAAARSRDWQTLARDQRRQWAQVYRQAALLADLLAEPLEDVLRHAAGVREAEWRADFRRRYQGRAVVFDSEVRRTADGYRLGYVLRAGDEEAQPDLG